MKKQNTNKTFQGLTDDELIERIETEYDNAYNFRKPIVNEWHENENILYGKKPTTLLKRSNIMVQLMAGFEDTLLSKIKRPVLIVYSPTEASDVIKARKVTSAWQVESSVTNEDWEYKDILIKKLAMISGRGIYKIHASYPYKHKLDPIDHYDFLVDPLTNGMSLESARYLGQDNIIKAEWELEGDSYDREKVKELIAAYADDHTEVPDNEDRQKANRFAVAGLDYYNYFQAGDASYKLTEWYTTIKGIRCVILLDKEKKIILKKKQLSEVTGELRAGEQPFWPFESWAYYPDLFNFWSPSPMSRVREVYILKNVSLNQMFDNNEAKNRPMRAFDPKVYTNPTALQYQPDKLIPVAAGRDPERGLYTLPVNDINEPKEFQDIIDNLVGKITGVTPAASGLAETEKVGIYYGDQQEIEKRMSLFEISYNRAHLRLAQKYVKYLSERLDKNTSIRILGEDGVEREDLTQEDLAVFDVTLTGGLSQAANDAIEKKQKNEFINAQRQNPLVNQKFLIELGMALNGFNQSDIKRALEKDDQNEEQIVRASNDIQKILKGEKFRPYLKADVKYMERIFDFVYDKEMDKEDEDKLLAYLKEIQPVVLRNMLLRAKQQMALKGMLEAPAQAISGVQEQAPQSTVSNEQNPNEPLLNSQQGIDQQRVQEVPGEAQQLYDRSK